VLGRAELAKHSATSPTIYHLLSARRSSPPPDLRSSGRVLTQRDPPRELWDWFDQRGPGLEVSRDGVEVGTAAGSFARDSTNAIS
jgi:hypothetical protein